MWNRLLAAVSAGFSGELVMIDSTCLRSHYEDGLRQFVKQVQERAASEGMSTLCPADEAELAERG